MQLIFELAIYLNWGLSRIASIGMHDGGARIRDLILCPLKTKDAFAGLFALGDLMFHIVARAAIVRAPQH